MKNSFVLAALPLLLATTALANPATQDGADRLTQVFQTYLGSTEGVISVEPNGDVYDLTLDAAPLIGLGQQAGLTGTVTLLEMQLTDNGDGTWGVAMDQAISFTLSKVGEFDVKEDIASTTLEGTFDEKLMTFSTLKGEFSGVKVTETVTAPEGQTHAEVSLDKGTVETTAAVGANGGSDSTTTMTASGLTEVVTTPPMGDGQPGMPVTIKADSLTQTATGTGFRNDGIYKTVAWFVAHADQAAMKADKAGLKTILTGALPFFDNLDSKGTLDKLTVDTPMGTVGLDQIGFELDVNGAVADGKLREAFTLSGLTLPAGIVPDWAAPILPQKISLDIQASDFDAAAGVTALLDALDLPDGMADTTEFNTKLRSAWLPKGTVTVTLNPGAVTGDGYELTYEGSMAAGPDTPMPTGTAKVTLAGAEKLQAALNSAPDDIKAQAMMGFGMAQGMAKQENGKLVWEIDASRPGALSVNGTPMMGGN